MSFIAGLKQGWGLGSNIREALDQRELRTLYENEQAAAGKAAEQTGRTVDVLPESQIGRGYGIDTGGEGNANSYATRDAGTKDMIVRQEQDIRALQGDARQDFANRRGLLDSAGRDKGVRTYALKPGDVDTNRMRRAEPPPVNAEPRVSERGYTGPGGAYAETKEQLPGYGAQITIPAKSASQIFQEKGVPKIVAKLESQGRLKEAQAFRQWAQDERTQRYSAAWVEALNAATMGDMAGAAEKIQQLYNTQVPDGQHVVLLPNKDGSYVAQIRNTETGDVVRQFNGSLNDIVQMGLGVLSPEQRFRALWKAREKDDKVVVVPAGGAAIRSDGSVLREQGLRPGSSARSAGGNVRWEKGKNPETGKMQHWRVGEDGEIVWGPEIVEKTTKTTGGGSRSTGGAKPLTAAQKRENASIEAARIQIDAMAKSGQDVNAMAQTDKALAETLARARRPLHGGDERLSKWSSEAGKGRNLAPLVDYFRKGGKDATKLIAAARARGWTREEIKRARAQAGGN